MSLSRTGAQPTEPQTFADDRVVDWNIPNSVSLQVSQDAGFTNVIFPRTFFGFTIDNTIEGSYPRCSNDEMWARLRDEDGNEASFGRHESLPQVDCGAFGILPEESRGEWDWALHSPTDSSQIVGQFDAGDDPPRSGITSPGTCWIQLYTVDRFGSETIHFSQPFELTEGLPTADDAEVTDVTISEDNGSFTVMSVVENPVAAGVDVDLRLTATDTTSGSVDLERTRTETLTGVSNWGEVNENDTIWQIGEGELPGNQYNICVEALGGA